MIPLRTTLLRFFYRLG